MEQLFEDDGVMEQEPAEPAIGILETGATEDTGEGAELAEPQIPDKVWETARKRAEREAESKYSASIATEKAERDKLAKQNIRLVSALGINGFKGTSEEIADQLEAQNREVAPDVIRAEREERERKQQAEQGTQSQLDALLKLQAERMATEDLGKIRKLDPNIKSLDELGEPYFKLVSAGVDAVTAFSAVSVSKPKAKPAPDDKSHMVPTGGSAAKADMLEIPTVELEFYCESFPHDTHEQLKERYNRILKRQKEN